MMSSPKLVSLPPPALCRAGVGVPGSSQPCTNTFPACSCQTPWCAGGSPSLLPTILPPSLSQLLILSALLAPSLFSLCVQNSTKALAAPRAVTQTVKNVYVLVAFHFCVLILHTQAHALTHGVPGASTGCWPREPSQSKGIWALLEKAGKEERKIQKQKRIWRQAAPPACAAAPAVDGSCIAGGLPGCAIPAIPPCPLSPTQHSLWDWGR